MTRPWLPNTNQSAYAVILWMLRLTAMAMVMLMRAISVSLSLTIARARSLWRALSQSLSPSLPFLRALLEALSLNIFLSHTIVLCRNHSLAHAITHSLSRACNPPLLSCSLSLSRNCTIISHTQSLSPPLSHNYNLWKPLSLTHTYSARWQTTTLPSLRYAYLNYLAIRVCCCVGAVCVSECVVCACVWSIH